jgi:hypothetical protein
MLKSLRSVKVIEALFSTVEEKNNQNYKERAMEEYDHEPLSVFDIDHTLQSTDDVIRFDIMIGYQCSHVLEAEGEFTPSDHEVQLKDALVIRCGCWIGEEEFYIPVTKKVKELILNKIINE